MNPAGCKSEEIVKYIRDEKLDEGIGLYKLTIIDSYFFKNIIQEEVSATEMMILGILDGFKELKKLEIVVPRQYYKEEEQKGKEKIEEKLKDIIPNFEKIDVFKKEKFHDRFWIINDEKGFIVGASINGMYNKKKKNNKHFYIQDDFLSKKDIKTLLWVYREDGVGYPPWE